MKYLKVKDSKTRKIVNNFELKKVLLKSFLKNREISLKLKEHVFLILKKFPNKSSKCKVNNRCVFSNRSKSVFKRYKLSRIFLKKLTSEIKLFGVYKKS